MRAVASVVGMIVAVALLAGCSFAPVQLTLVAGSPTPSASPTPSPIPEPVSCDSLLDDETKARFAEFADDGWAFSESWAEQLLAHADFYVDDQFLEFGGVACLWGYADSDTVFAYGYSAISENNARVIQLKLETDGYQRSYAQGGVLYCLPPELSSYESCYLFRGTDWFLSTIESELEMLVSQVDAD